MNVWLPLCKYQVHQSHDIRFGHVGYLIVCKTTDFLLKFQNYDEIMDPLNLSNLECTPAETRAALKEYQDEIWHLPEKSPISKKSSTLKALDRKLWQVSYFKNSDCFHCLHVFYNA